MATSKLQKMLGNLLDKNFPQYRIRENYRPDWLISSNGTKLELDFFIEDINIAFEVQGAQHYQFIEFFHRTYDKYEQRKDYDKQKRDLCYGKGVRLIEVFTETDAEVAVNDIYCKYIHPTNILQILPPPAWRAKEEKHEVKKNRKISKNPNTEDALVKFALDRRNKRNIINSTKDKKLIELRKFKEKIGRYIDGSYSKLKYFEFIYLNDAERDIALAEFGILQIIDPKNDFCVSKNIDLIELIKNNINSL